MASDLWNWTVDVFSRHIEERGVVIKRRVVEEECELVVSQSRTYCVIERIILSSGYILFASLNVALVRDVVVSATARGCVTRDKSHWTSAEPADSACEPDDNTPSIRLTDLVMLHLELAKSDQCL